MKNILVTGSNGLLGQKVVEALLNKGYSVTGIGTSEFGKCQHELFRYMSINLTKSRDVEKLFKESQFTHVIHLAALAHVTGESDLSWNRYYRINTLCSKTLFECVCEREIPVFFASTIDVYGITNKTIDENTKPHPVGYYAVSKKMAEDILLSLVSSKQSYLIARFAPVHTNENQRDIQKRYYIKYPKLGFLIDKGLDYEFLHIDNAVAIIDYWLDHYDNMFGTINWCDKERYNTKALLEKEREMDKAKIILPIPGFIRWVIKKIVDSFLSNKSSMKLKVYKIISPINTDSTKRDELTEHIKVDRDICYQLDKIEN